MQLDTEAAVSIIPEATYKNHLSKFTLTERRAILETNWNCWDRYMFRSNMSHKELPQWPLVVAKGNKVPLLGRNYLYRSHQVKLG